MKPAAPEEAPALPLSAKASVAEIAAHPILNRLDGAELVIYLRLLGATVEAKSRKVQITNAALFRSPDRTVKALKRLVLLQLIKVSFDPSKPTGQRRTFEVAR